MRDEELPQITLPSTNAVANTATIFVQSFTQPDATTVLVPPGRKPGDPGTTVVDPSFKWAVKAITYFAVGCLVVEVLLSLFLPEAATHFQETAFSAVDWGFKGGLGAVVGLVTGKQA